MHDSVRASDLAVQSPDGESASGTALTDAAEAEQQLDRLASELDRCEGVAPAAAAARGAAHCVPLTSVDELFEAATSRLACEPEIGGRGL